MSINNKKSGSGDKIIYPAFPMEVIMTTVLLVAWLALIVVGFFGSMLLLKKTGLYDD